MFTKSTMRALKQLCLFLLIPTMFSASALAQQAAPRTTPTRRPAVNTATGGATLKLPLRRIVLYKSGVGYFEHEGQVRGNQDIEIALTSSQLNDILKSLTALDLNGGRIVGATYNSQDPTGHELASLPIPMADMTSLSELLQVLRGSRLEARNSSGSFRGRLLSVNQQTRHEKDASVSIDEIALLGDDGAVRSFALGTGTNLRFTDPELDRVLSRALGLLDSSHQEDIRHLVLSTTGTGDRTVHVSYTSEVPVWKTTYRIVMPGAESPASAKPLLQGWAIVDNTVGEDWNNVEISLAAGAPQSFIQQLSQPYYTARPVVPMPRGVLLMPQTHGGTLTSAETASAAALPANASAAMVDNRAISETPVNGRNYSGNIDDLFDPSATGTGSGGGIASGAFRTGRDGPATRGQVALTATDFLTAARSINAAEGNPLGDLFEYKPKDRVTIHKNQSALVPIVQTEISAEKVVLWNAGLGTPRPLRALWFTNTSPLVLDGGSFNVIDGGAFGGEGLVDSLQPGEKRLISYATDLGMQVVAKQDAGAPGASNRVTRVRIARGTMIRTVESRQRTTYTMHNEDNFPRTVILEHPVRAAWKLASDLKPVEQSATAYRFRVEVPSKETRTFSLEETRPIETRVGLSNLTDAQIQTFVAERDLTPEMEKALRDIVARKNAIAAFDADLKASQTDVDALFKDQERLRENMKALKGTPDERALIQRYANELGNQETQLGAVRDKMADVTNRKKAVQQELGETIEKLEFDTTL